MSFIPAPVAAYQLPDGSFVSSPEEYAAKLAEKDCAVKAKAYIEANADKFPKGLATRTYNTVFAYLSWEAGQNALAALRVHESIGA